LVDNYKKLESAREDLLGDLKRFANDMLDRVERSRLMSKDFDPDQHVAMARRETKKIAFPNFDFERSSRKESIKDTPSENEHMNENEPVKAPQLVVTKSEEVYERQPAYADVPAVKKVQKSFFDEIG